MNTKLFYPCLIITFGMLLWIIIQPSALTFIGIREAIAFISMILVFFSITWNEKGGWKLTAIILLIVLGLGLFVEYLAFDYNLIIYPRATIVICFLTVISIFLHIKYFEPKISSYFKNKTGDVLDYGRCPNCNNTYYGEKMINGVKHRDDYSSSVGVNLCQKCIDHPEKLNPDTIAINLKMKNWTEEEISEVQIAINKFKKEDKTLLQ